MQLAMNEAIDRFLANPPGFLPLTTGITIDLVLRYLFFAGVAWLLGYKEVATFSHAFRRWTGKAPSAYAARGR